MSSFTIIHLCFYVPSLQCVIINKSDDKKTVRSRVEESAVDYWAVHVGGIKNKIKHFYANQNDE